MNTLLLILLLLLVILLAVLIALASYSERQNIYIGGKQKNFVINNKITYRFPITQTPQSIAFMISQNPYISLKIDGLFKRVTPHEYHLYYPPIPHHWTNVEGEYYYDDKLDKYILYIFNINTQNKKSNINHNVGDMYHEIETFFEKSTHFKIKSKNKNINEDMLQNINNSFEWVSKYNGSKICWFPKKYWKLITTSWNAYIDQLNSIFNYALTIDIIKHDGLVITPKFKSSNLNLIKLKPKNEMTIDLLYKNGDWLSYENISYKHLVEESSIKLDNGGVYRLEPINNSQLYKVREKREPGKKPNGDNVVKYILYIFNNYFTINQLKNNLLQPWYGKVLYKNLDKLDLLFKFTQGKYKKIIMDHKINSGTVYDFGCGKMGNYCKILLDGTITEYTGFDIDLQILHKASLELDKYKNKPPFKFILFNIAQPWDKQNAYFFNDLWDTFYKNALNLEKLVDNFLSIFSIQYANISTNSWNTFIEEVNKRAKDKITKFFIMFIDLDKIDKKKHNTFAKYNHNNTLTITLPHRPPHNEPAIGMSQIQSSFSDGWEILEMSNAADFTHLPIVYISDYINLVSWIVLQKK